MTPLPPGNNKRVKVCAASRHSGVSFSATIHWKVPPVEEIAPGIWLIDFPTPHGPVMIVTVPRSSPPAKSASSSGTPDEIASAMNCLP